MFHKKTGYILLIFLLLLGSKAGFGQLKLTLNTDNDYLPNIKIKKVMVCMDDLTVWALSEDGKAYYKKKNETAFKLYSGTASLVISEITGFNFDEMYFLVKPDIICYFKDQVRQDINIPTVTTINNIAFMNGKRNPVFNKYYGKTDWIAIATDNGMYRLLRNSSAVPSKYTGNNTKDDDWHITNSGFKSVDFQFRSPDVGCYGSVEHAYYNTLGNTDFITVLPEAAPYTNKINCTLFDFPFDKSDVSGSMMFNFWGTDNGLYVKRFSTCDQGVKVLPDQVINELEELDMLRGINSQKFVLTATDGGLFYTPASVSNYRDQAKDIDSIKFEPFGETVNTRINGIATELYNKDDQITDTTFTLCEKVVWLATENGIKKLDVSLDQIYYDAHPLEDGDHILFSRSPDVNAPLHPVFKFCKNDSLIVKAENKNLVVQWFKDNVEMKDSLGKWFVNLKDTGTYYYKIAVPCEGISLRSIPFTIEKIPLPEITFNYPNPIVLCEGGDFTLTTKDGDGYTYKWFKNNVEIPGAAAHSYTVTSTGVYRVEVENCAGTETSSTADISFAIIPDPVIRSVKSKYCVGESGALTIGDQSPDIKIMWYLYDELGFHDLDEHQSTIFRDQEGTYLVYLENEKGCTPKLSLPFDFEINRYPLPPAIITGYNGEKLCHGNTVTLSAPILEGATYKWSTGDTTQTIDVGSPDLYNVEVTSEFGCPNTSDPVEVKFYDRLLSGNPADTKICVIKREQVILTARPGFVSYKWNGIRGVNTLKVKEPGAYQLVVEGINGCLDTVTYMVVPGCKDVLMPNAFSPNGDGTNDTWRVSGLENDHGANITIYDRFGSPVFKCTGINCPWDGKMNGNDVPVGVYYYVVRTKNSKTPLTGSITLIR